MSALPCWGEWQWTGNHLFVLTVTSCRGDPVCHPQIYQSATALSWPTYCAQPAGLLPGHQNIPEDQVLPKAGLGGEAGQWRALIPASGKGTVGSSVLTQYVLPSTAGTWI